MVDGILGVTVSTADRICNPRRVRSRAASSTARWRSTTPSIPKQRRSKASHPRSPAARRFSSCPISKPATCWPKTRRSSPRRTRREWYSARACRSFSPRARIPCARAWPSCAVAMLYAHARRQYCAGAPLTRHSNGTVQDRGRHNFQRAQAALAPVSVLRRPHGHHREIPARLLAALPFSDIHRRDQDRHIMIKAVRGNISVSFRRLSTSDHARRCGNWATALFNNLRARRRFCRSRPARSIPPTFSLASQNRPNQPRIQTAQREIPIASDAPPRPTSRGFLVWGFFCQGVRQSGKSFVLRQFLCSISKPVSSSRPAVR